MSITIADHVFEGPYTSTKELMNDPGVFAVIVANGDKGALIDVGESSNVGECVENHPDKSRWHQFSTEGKLCFAVLYIPASSPSERHTIEQQIRSQYS
ncbi:MAG: hypothetical protein KKA42_11485 [candidate division Zixibacteria bacterium]|nr:hypothetical protein [candidate division Zixibacteria bacterium]